jgi:signal transduction histidine kinase
MVVERHGGSVGLDSPTDGGARFWFRLPLTPIAAKPAAPVASTWAVAT